MPEIHPNDIGLATYADVGDVSKLKTAAKNVVDALNEIFNLSSSNYNNQIYVEGENNTILGENNIVYGNNNFIIGSNNIVVGDNLNIIADGVHAMLNPWSNFSEYVDAESGAIYFYEPLTDSAPFKVGDKVAVAVSQSWIDEDWTDFKFVSGNVVIGEITQMESGDHCIYVNNLGVSAQPPDDIHTMLDSSNTDVFIGLNDSFKLIGEENNLLVGTGTAYKSHSIALNVGEVLGQYALAANSASVKGSYSAGFNRSIVAGQYGFGCNESECQGIYSAAFNYATSYSPYSLASGMRSIACGRALKCISLNVNSKTITLEQNQNLTGIAGKKIIIRVYNKNNAIMHTLATVKSISGETLYLDDVFFGSGDYAPKLFPEPYIFVVDTLTTYSNSNCAGGSFSVASGKYSFAHGDSVLAGADGAVVFGKCGNLSDPYSLALANGNSLKEPGLAFKVLTDGSVHADAEYTTPCADYAEFFEWYDGNPLKEDRAGFFVKLCGEKIVKCDDFDVPLGVISATPAIVGDSGELHWKNKYQTDEFGRIQYHEVVVPAMLNDDDEVIIEEHTEIQPIINSEWDSHETYIPRKERSEWAPVGVLGKLIVYDDGSLNPGDICRTGNGGIAVKSIDNGYPVLKRISDNKILIWFKG